MEINKKLLIGIMIICFSCMTKFQVSYGDEKCIVEDILQTVNSSIEEINAVGSIYTNKSEDEIYNSIKLQMEKKFGQVKECSEDKNKFTVKDKGEEYSCEIVLASYQGEYEVKLSVSIYGENLTLNKKDKLKTMVRSVLSIIDSDVEYSLCVKSKIIDDTMDEVRNEVVDKLSLYKTKNTDEVKLTNGYSIVGYTGLYPKREVLGQDIDFNCAIVKYSSGCYLIIGESEITISY